MFANWGYMSSGCQVHFSKKKLNIPLRRSPSAIFGDHLFIHYLLAFLPVDNFSPHSKHFFTEMYWPKSFPGLSHFLSFASLFSFFNWKLEMCKKAWLILKVFPPDHIDFQWLRMLTLQIFWAKPECWTHFVAKSRMFYSVSDIFVLSSQYNCIVKRERITIIRITSAWTCTSPPCQLLFAVSENICRSVEKHLEKHLGTS